MEYTHESTVYKVGGDGDAMEDENQSSSNGIRYNREIVKPLKHNNDFVSTRKESAKSEVVKDMSLADVISQRKIASVAKKDRSSSSNNGNGNGARFTNYVDRDVDPKELGLDDIIRRQKEQGQGQGNQENSLKSSLDRSLDDYIKERNGAKAGSGAGVKRKLQEETQVDPGDEDDEYALAPLDIIEQVTNSGLVIEHEIGKQVDESMGRSHNWRATFRCGDVSAVSEAPLKMLARQSAAMEFVNALRKMEPNRRIPKCRIPEACFFDPVVISRLNDVIKGLGIDEPKFETVLTKHLNRDWFTTTYFIGEDEFLASSYKEDFSKLLAAKAAYETYSQRTFPREQFFTGEKCIKDKEYVCRETEATHVMTVKRGPAAMVSDVIDDFDVGLQGHFQGKSEQGDGEPEDQLLMDDRGRMYGRCSGSNKIRRLNPVNIEAIVEQKILGLIAAAGGASAVDDTDIMDDIFLANAGGNGDEDEEECM